jgi:hypothetical protein
VEYFEKSFLAMCYRQNEKIVVWPLFAALLHFPAIFAKTENAEQPSLACYMKNVMKTLPDSETKYFSLWSMLDQ